MTPPAKAPSHAQADQPALSPARANPSKPDALRRVFAERVLPAAVAAGVPELRPDGVPWWPLSDVEAITTLVRLTGHTRALAVCEAALALREWMVRRAGESREDCAARWVEGYGELVERVEAAWAALEAA